jgi:hypothetical protein
MRLHRYVLAGLLLLPSATAGYGQQIFAYPNQGQSPEQQNRDNADCHTWAVQQSRFDPFFGSPPPSAGGGVVRGAAGGAALGAVGGAIAGDAGQGAAIGAATGALFGGMRQHRQRQEQAAWSSQAQANYNRAFSACMQARGYTVR